MASQSNQDTEDQQPQAEGANPSRDNGPTQRRAEEKLKKETPAPRRKPAPSDFFNGA